MRMACIIVTLVTLMACGGPAPTATPDVTTPAGYRQATLARIDTIARSVETVNADCSRESLDKCTKTVDDQRARFLPESDFLRSTKFPQICMGLFSGNLGLVNNAEDFFDTMQRTVKEKNADVVKQRLAEKYSTWTRGKTGADSFLATDPCR